MVDAYRLLLVEDDPHDIELIQMALASYPFIQAMDIVEDGEQALLYLLGEESIQANRPLPRMVLLDLKLPKVGGVQVLEAIRRHPRTRNLVVVVMTSSSEDRDLEACYQLGVNSYIVKPVDSQQFCETSQKVGVYWMQLNRPAYLLV